MSRGFGTRGLRVRLKRLEDSVGKGAEHCPWCLLNVRHSWPGPGLTQLRPEHLVKRQCDLCDADMIFDLTGRTEEEREYARLCYSFSLEDTYTNRVAFAFELWRKIYPSKAETPRPRKLAAAEDDGCSPGGRMLEKLRAEAEALLLRKRKRLASKYGDPYLKVAEFFNPGKEDRTARWHAHFGVRGLPELVQERAVYLSCAELEKVIWSRVRPDTASAVEELERKIGRLIEDERARTEAEEEEARRKRAGEEEARLKQAVREAATWSLKEAEERGRGVKTRLYSPEPSDEWSGMHVFDIKEYERQIASGTHPSGQVPPRRVSR